MPKLLPVALPRRAESPPPAPPEGDVTGLIRERLLLALGEPPCLLRVQVKPLRGSATGPMSSPGRRHGLDGPQLLLGRGGPQDRDVRPGDHARVLTFHGNIRRTACRAALGATGDRHDE